MVLSSLHVYNIMWRKGREKEREGQKSTAITHVTNTTNALLLLLISYIIFDQEKTTFKYKNATAATTTVTAAAIAIAITLHKNTLL